MKYIRLNPVTRRSKALTCNTLCFFFPVPGRSDEPRGHPPPEWETSRSGGQLPAGAPPQTGRCHHPVQPAQAVEHHGEAGAQD